MGYGGTPFRRILGHGTSVPHSNGLFLAALTGIMEGASQHCTIFVRLFLRALDLYCAKAPILTTKGPPAGYIVVVDPSPRY